MCGTVYGIYQLTMVRVELLLAVIVNDTVSRASLSGSDLADIAYYLDSSYKHLLCMKYHHCGCDTSTSVKNCAHDETKYKLFHSTLCYGLLAKSQGYDL